MIRQQDSHSVSKKKIKHIIRLTDYTMDEVQEIFKIAEKLQQGEYQNFLSGKTIVLFFPESSIRTRVAFERGIYLLGGQSILFPPETLDKKEEIEDVVGYLNQWIDAAVIRHKDIHLLEEIARYADFPVVNGMTDLNHPCEMLGDLYALSKIRPNYLNDQYLFVGAAGNIGYAWKEAAELAGFRLRQCCPNGYEIEGIEVFHNIQEGVKGADIICSDSIPKAAQQDFSNFQITEEIMGLANPSAVLNPCPPFYRGEEVSQEVIDSDAFVGYEFKKNLLEIQQAILIHHMLI